MSVCRIRNNTLILTFRQIMQPPTRRDLPFPSWRAGDPSSHHWSLECPSGKMTKCSYIHITFLLVWWTAGIGHVLCQPGDSQTSFWPDLGPMPWDGLTGEDQPQPGIAITAHTIFSPLSQDSM